MIISRSERRFILLSIVALLVLCPYGTAAFAADRPIVLENDQVALEVDPAFGTIVRILDKSSRIELISAPSLAGNYRLDLLMPDKKVATILGKEQKLSSIEQISGGLALNWDGPLKDTTGTEHQLAVRMDIKAAGNALEFNLHVDNRTDAKVRKASYPMIGGLSKFGAPGKPADGMLWVPTSRPSVKKIELPFRETAFGYPGHANMSFTCVQSAAAKKSLYFASHDKIARYKAYLFQEHADDKAKDVFACIQHHPFTPPGKIFDGSPVVLRFIDGDWWDAGQVYREFFTSTFGLADRKKDWIRKQSFFLMTMFMLPEGTINYTFKDIPRWAKVAKDYGIDAVQISGWQMGGHDNGYPYYIPDPRLGTWEELEEGIRASKPFKLDKDGVQVLVSGWSSIGGTGNPHLWNYVTLNLTDGTEIDRVYAPNTTNFVPVYLDGSKHKGKSVHIQAVDDADQATCSMLCIDDVRTVDRPNNHVRQPLELPPFDPAKSVRLEDKNILIEVSRENGSIIKIYDKHTKLDLILEPRLAGSWKFAFPLPGKEPWQTIEANWIIGRQQKLSSLEMADKKITLKWDGPLKNYLGESYNASVTETIELVDGTAVFNLAIENHTPYQMGETYFPIIGGIQGLGTNCGQLKSTEFVRPAGKKSATKANVFFNFANMPMFGHTTFGDTGPEQFYAYPKTLAEPWVEFRSRNTGRSVYIGSHDPSDREKIMRLELVPSRSDTLRGDGNWPRPYELKGLPVGIEFSMVDCMDGTPGKNYTAAPVMIKFHDGNRP